MYVAELSVRDFRSYENATVHFVPGINVLIGTNGQGKTNLVEAISYLATFSSHRVASDVPLVRKDCAGAGVKVVLDDQGRQISLEIEITPGKANKAKLNGSPVTRAREVLGALLTVVFAPEDLMLVKGDPSERRKFLDDTLTMITPSYAGVRGDYEKVLKQRNALLKSAYNKRDADAMRTLDVWDAQLARAGAAIIFNRHSLVTSMQPLVRDSYTTVSDDRGPCEISYQSSLGIDCAGQTQDLLEAALLDALSRRRKDELDRGVTLVGPHRDELVVELRGLPVRGYASHGESWSVALALKLAVFDLVRDVSRHGDPVLVLDDVFAELDEIRRRKLVELVQKCEQTIVTAAVAADVPADLDGARFDVFEGSVNRVV
jgi:DNA replication and repair protein RecF